MDVWVPKVTSQEFQQRRPLCCLQVGQNSPPWSREGSPHWISPYFNVSVRPPLEPRPNIQIYKYTNIQIYKYLFKYNYKYKFEYWWADRLLIITSIKYTNTNIHQQSQIQIQKQMTIKMVIFCWSTRQPHCGPMQGVQHLFSSVSTLWSLVPENHPLWFSALVRCATDSLHLYSTALCWSMLVTSGHCWSKLVNAGHHCFLLVSVGH